tara:strand:- start:412 stop:702 length:291 start_codon:yes stop_codon:yes gene_type:complete
MRIFIKKLIFIISLIVFNNSYACENNNFKKDRDDIANWLGSNSYFSASYKKGKCALDTVLSDLSLEQRRVIANLIAKSYAQSMKNSNENSNYQHLF